MGIGTNTGDAEDLLLFHPSLATKAKVPEQHKDRTKTESTVNKRPRTGADPSFTHLGLDPWLLNTLSSLSLTRPTPVQQACISVLLGSESDVVGVAQTGSGKTAAFALPILNDLNKDPYGPFALVLTPTRELAIQIDEQFRVFGRGINLRTVVCIGGIDMMDQSGALKRRPHVIIATPGRLVDVIESGGGETVDLRRLKYLVIDEADRLLDQKSKFKGELSVILGKVFTRNRPRVLLFTATLSDDVRTFVHLKSDPFIYLGNTEYGTAPTVQQRYLFIPSKVKDTYLYHLLTTDLVDKSVIVFVGKCVTAELLTLSLRRLKVAGGIVSLHSQHPQRVRTHSLQLFKNGSARALVATDVAARGLDIPAVHTVINYDIPADPRDYVHRIGRTGRAGLVGHALSMVGELDIDLVQAIEARTGKQLSEYTPEPKEDLVLQSLNKCSDARQWASMCLQEIGFGKRGK